VLTSRRLGDQPPPNRQSPIEGSLIDPIKFSNSAAGSHMRWRMRHGYETQLEGEHLVAFGAVIGLGGFDTKVGTPVPTTLGFSMTRPLAGPVLGARASVTARRPGATSGVGAAWWFCLCS
jgi:hypothetical protein